MKLLDLIKKGGLAESTTANVANLANTFHDRKLAEDSLAKSAIATKSNSTKVPTAPAFKKIGTYESSAETTASRWWRVFYTDNNAVEVACSPPATRAEILTKRVGATAAEPFEPTCRLPTTALTSDEEVAIREWLAHIKETDADIITDVINQCRQNADARKYYLER